MKLVVMSPYVGSFAKHACTDQNSLQKNYTCNYIQNAIYLYIFLKLQIHRI